MFTREDIKRAMRDDIQRFVKHDKIRPTNGDIANLAADKWIVPDLCGLCKDDTANIYQFSEGQMLPYCTFCWENRDLMIRDGLKAASFANNDARFIGFSTGQLITR